MFRNAKRCCAETRTAEERQMVQSWRNWSEQRRIESTLGSSLTAKFVLDVDRHKVGSPTQKPT
jgi:hypothetical protein